MDREDDVEVKFGQQVERTKQFLLVSDKLARFFGWILITNASVVGCVQGAFVPVRVQHRHVE